MRNNNSNLNDFVITKNTGGLKIPRRLSVITSSIEKRIQTLQKANIPSDYFDTEYAKKIKKNAILLNEIK